MQSCCRLLSFHFTALCRDDKEWNVVTPPHSILSLDYCWRCCSATSIGPCIIMIMPSLILNWPNKNCPRKAFLLLLLQTRRIVSVDLNLSESTSYCPAWRQRNYFVLENSQMPLWFTNMTQRREIMMPYSGITVTISGDDTFNVFGDQCPWRRILCHQLLQCRGNNSWEDASAHCRRRSACLHPPSSLLRLPWLRMRCARAHSWIKNKLQPL